MTRRDYWTCDRCGVEKFGQVRGMFDARENDGTTRPHGWRPVSLKLVLQCTWLPDVTFHGDLCGDCVGSVRDAVRAALEKPAPAPANASQEGP